MTRRREGFTFTKALRSLLGPDTGVDKNTPIFEAPYVVIDTELTGLDGDKDSIVSVGAVRMTGGRIDLGDSFYRLVKPTARITPASVMIHEITPADVAMEPAIDGVLDEFLAFCRGDIVVGYCIAIDLEFIDRELKRLHRAAFTNPALDIRSLCNRVRRRLPSLETMARIADNARLHEIAAGFDIPIDGAHNAVMDAFITAQLLQRLLPLLHKTGIERVGDLLQAGHPSRQYDVYESAGGMYNL